ncbi:hypothetical protein ACIO02_38035 [Streptomyces sp. NPDC087568]|uniref:hypothetical protein n=1 Tax=Streptomyces sp. NPDC087568 TaxID=3365799 RepID=UPI00382AEF0D
MIGAFGLCWHVVFWLVLSDLDTLDPGIRHWGALSGGPLALTGLVLMAVGQRAGGNRQGGGMP